MNQKRNTTPEACDDQDKQLPYLTELKRQGSEDVVSNIILVCKGRTRMLESSPFIFIFFQSYLREETRGYTDGCSQEPSFSRCIVKKKKNRSFPVLLPQLHRKTYTPPVNHCVNLENVSVIIVLYMLRLLYIIV